MTDLAALARDELRVHFGFVPDSDKAVIQVRIGDLFHVTTMKAPSLLLGDALTWRKGELRKALDETVVGMCKQIAEHGSMFKDPETK